MAAISCASASLGYRAELGSSDERRPLHRRLMSREPLNVRSLMPDNGIISSDGMEADYLKFTAGMSSKKYEGYASSASRIGPRESIVVVVIAASISSMSMEVRSHVTFTNPSTTISKVSTAS